MDEIKKMVEKLEEDVERLEEELPPLKCIRMRHRMTQARDGWCKQHRDIEDIKAFGELCKPLVDWLQRNHGVAQTIIITPESATLYGGEIGVPYDWDCVVEH